MAIRAVRIDDDNRANVPSHQNFHDLGQAPVRLGADYIPSLGRENPCDGTRILYLPDVSCDFSNCPQRSVKLRRNNLRQARWRDSVRPKNMKTRSTCHQLG